VIFVFLVVCKQHFSCGLLAETENMLKLRVNKRVSELPGGPEGEGVLDGIGNGGGAIRFTEPMGVNPEPVRTVKLFINEARWWFPDGDAGLPSKRNAKQAQPEINDSAFHDSNWECAGDPKAQFRWSDPLQIGGITKEAENSLDFHRKLHGKSQVMYGFA
jgi:hypothetical protein